MYKEWSDIKKLIWLFRNALPHGATYQTITGKIVSFLTQRIAPLKIEAALSPIQDLHGYDAPWPPGGGTNKLGLKEWLTSIGVTYTESGNSITINTAGQMALYSNPFVFSSTDIQVTLSVASFVMNSGSSIRLELLDSSNNVVGNYFSTTATPQTATASKFRINWSSGGEIVLQGVMLNTGSSALPFAPYSNICPITGHDGVEIYDNNGNWFSNANPQTGVYLSELNAINSYTGWNVSDYIAVKGNTQYYWEPNSTEGQVAKCWFYDADKNGISYISSGARTFTTPSNCRFMRFSYRDTSTDIMLNLGSTASAYEAYQGSSVTISFGQTVYGGKLTVNEDGTGSVVAEWKSKIIHSSDISNVNSETGYAMARLGDTNYIVNGFGMCNILKKFSGAASSTPNNNFNCIVSSGYNRSQFIFKLDFTSSTTTEQKQKYMDWIDELESNGGELQVVYKLATPITIPLTPGQVEALQGNNTVWVDDSGKIKVTFRSN